MILSGYGDEVVDFLRSIENNPVTADFYVHPYKRFRGVVESVSIPRPFEPERGSAHLISEVQILASEAPPILTAEGAVWGGSLMWGEGIWGGEVSA